MKKFFIFTLISCLALTSLFTACGKDGKGGAEVVEGEYLAKDGATEYKVVIPEDCIGTLQTAGRDFTQLFSEATGAEIGIVTDTGAEFSSSSRYISIGETALVRQAGLDIAYEEVGLGYKIKTVDKSIFVFGTKDTTSAYGVYGLLERLFGFEAFSSDCYYIEEKSQTPLIKFDDVEKPDIGLRPTGWSGYQYYDSDASLAMARMKIDPATSHVVQNDKGVKADVHTSFYYFTEKQFADNPEFKSIDGTQLCYTARGNAEKYLLMKDIVVEKMKEMVTGQPDKITIPFGHMDNSNWCTCEACSKIINANAGAKSATCIAFLNDVAEEMSAWLDENYPRRDDITIWFFAYTATITAPVITNAAGEYEPATPDMKLHKRLAVYYAPIESDWYYPLNDAEHNSTAYNTLESWSALTDNIYFWIYSTNFKAYFYFFDNFNSYVENYRYAKEKGGKLVFENAQYDMTNLTAFHNLKVYLSAKLGWDTDIDYNAAIIRYFDNCFGPASDTMYGIFTRMRLLYAENMQDDSFNGGNCLSAALMDQKYYPYRELMLWKDLFAKAKEEIAPLKDSDPEEYLKIYDRIAAEELSADYILVTLWDGKYTEAELTAKRAEFKERTMSLGFSNYLEGGSLINLYASWGV